MNKYTLQKTTNHMPLVSIQISEDLLAAMLRKAQPGLVLIHSKRDTADSSPSLSLFRRSADEINIRDLLLELLLFTSHDDRAPFMNNGKRLILTLDRGGDIFRFADLCNKKAFHRLLTYVTTHFLLVLEIVGENDLGIPAALERWMTANFSCENN